MPRGKKKVVVEVKGFDEINAGLAAVIKAHEDAAKDARAECEHLEQVRALLSVDIERAYNSAVLHQQRADALRKA